MKRNFLAAAIAGLVLLPCTLMAQVPAGAPAGATGKCKDGTFTTAPKKQGACRGHKGIDTWFAADSTPAKAPEKSAAPAPAPAAAPMPAPAVTPKPSSAPSTAQSAVPAPKAAASAKTPAPGGGPGLVWVNTETKVYHCYGTRYYGVTKAGKYMSEADAKSAGARPDRGKACSQ